MWLQTVDVPVDGGAGLPGRHSPDLFQLPCPALLSHLLSPLLRRPPHCCLHYMQVFLLFVL